jgi:hypothetical protein
MTTDTDKKPHDSNRGDTTEYPDAWKEPEVVDLTRRYKNWEDGFAVADIQPKFPKIDGNGQTGEPA